MSIEYANNVDNMYVNYIRPVEQKLKRERGRRERDRTVVGFTTTYAVSAYHHCCCEFESRSGRGVQHYVIKSVTCDRSVVFSRSSDFLHQ